MLSANSRALTPAVTELLDKVEQREINGDGPGQEEMMGKAQVSQAKGDWIKRVKGTAEVK